MNKNNTYKLLESKFVTYKDLLGISVEENGDWFVPLPVKLSSVAGAIGLYGSLDDMCEDFPLIPVRKEVKGRLDGVDRELKSRNPTYQLVVTYGFRSLEVQQQYFDQQRGALLVSNIRGSDFTDREDINELIHRTIAVPIVAGHPTGGAVDVTIVDQDSGTPLDFGTELYEFGNKDCYTFSPFVSQAAKNNRQLLRDVMLTQNFAPFDGEWWHFSFGDKEWASFYSQPSAVYAQTTSSIVLEDLAQQRVVYCIVRPGGNDTALVTGIELDPLRRKEINDAIMRQNPGVEQVGFVQLDARSPQLVMAGGEFCANATRATAWLALNGQAGDVSVTVSGVSRPLRAGVTPNGEAWTEMPIFADLGRVTILGDGMAIVEMEGITHVVIETGVEQTPVEQLKAKAFALLTQLELTTSAPAAGVMFVNGNGDERQLSPVVFVRDINTLFYETACGSGTTAVGLLEAYRQKKSVSLSLTQPSGMHITVTVEFDGKEFTNAVISGPISLLTKEQIL